MVDDALPPYCNQSWAGRVSAFTHDRVAWDTPKAGHRGRTVTHEDEQLTVEKGGVRVQPFRG
ncbi:hypothetical protein GCM10010222_38630 [Streptomyces tanashiensis]|nr:hypothetical protein GCM10010222_38630 [Streptomyces tanashiensis]